MSLRRTTRKGGFTLVELLVVMGVSAIVLGALGLLYAFTVGQTGGTLAELASTDQATTAARDVEWTIRNAMLCETKSLNGVTALRCTLPAQGVDFDGDGAPDSFRPTSLDKFGRGLFTAGTRVWFYTANSTGAFGTSGTVLWRATRTDDANPTSTNADTSWAYLYGRTASPRFPLVTAFSASVDSTNLLVTFSLTAQGVNYSDHAPSSADKTNSRRAITIARQSFWANWRS